MSLIRSLVLLTFLCAVIMRMALRLFGKICKSKGWAIRRWYSIGRTKSHKIGLRGKINASPAVVDVIILIICGIITVASSVCVMTFRSFPTFYFNAKKLVQKVLYSVFSDYVLFRF